MSATPPTAKRTQRHVDDLKKMPARSAALSLLSRAAEVAAPPNRPPESRFAPKALWEWIRSYLAYVFHAKHGFPAYYASPKRAVYDLLDENESDNVRVSLAGDWGTGTDEAEAVADQILSFNPHFTIHIGDV